MEDNPKKQKNTGRTENKSTSDEKYIHVSEIPIQKLDEDAAFQDGQKEKRHDSAINQKLKAEKDNDTMGIP